MFATMKDADFSFSEAAKQREERRRFLSDIDPRRRSVSTSTPSTGKSPWRVKQLTEADKEPRWTCTADKAGKKTYTEHRPPANSALFDARNRPQNASRFTLEIVRGVGLCLEFSAEAGDRVECLGTTAIELIQGGSAVVVEEIRPAM